MPINNTKAYVPLYYIFSKTASSKCGTLNLLYAVHITRAFLFLGALLAANFDSKDEIICRSRAGGGVEAGAGVELASLPSHFVKLIFPYRCSAAGNE